MLSPEHERFLTRAALLLSFPAWAGLGYSLLRYTAKTQLDSDSYLTVPANTLTIAAMICGFVSMLCSLPSLSYDITDKSAWLLIIWCSLPFILITSLLNPFSYWYSR